jgi:peptide/nickel transport system permease protein
MTAAPGAATVSEAAVVPSARRRPNPLRRLANRVGGGEALTGILIMVALILIAILAPWTAPHDPEAIDSSRILAPPDLAHPFGSDSLGRDVFSRVLYAFRVSLSVAIGSVALAFLIAVPLGLLSGFSGGWVDSIIMRPLDLLLALPALLLAITLIAIVGPGALVALIAIAIIYLPIVARVTRGSVLVTKGLPYVDGARSRGVSELTLLRRHVLPNSMGPALIQGTVLIAFAIQVEAALSFLGLGAQPPTPSLGVMLNEGRDVLTLAPWVEIFPGVAIVITVLAFTLIGDGLRRRLDPRGVAR